MQPSLFSFALPFDIPMSIAVQQHMGPLTMWDSGQFGPTIKQESAVGNKPKKCDSHIRDLNRC